MRKIGLMTLAATLPWMTMFAGMDDQAATLSLPAEIDFTAAEPISGVTLFGKRERLFDGAAYVCAAIKINCLAYQDVVLEFNAKTVGTPAATVGAILYRHESGELKILSRSQWLHPVRAGEYGPVRVEFPGHCVVTDGEYEIYLYRSNQQGALYLDTARISQKPVDKKISFSFLDTPDLVSPLKPGPSGMRDYHLAVTGVNPHKGIKEVVVLTDTQGRWTSGDDVKKNFWMVQYYDSNDFANGRRNPLNNFDGAIHRGIAGMDAFIESSSPEPVGVTFTCEVLYDDNSKDSWTIMPAPPPKQLPEYRFAHRDNQLVARSDFNVPPAWTPLKIGQRSFYHAMVWPDNEKGAIRRLMSPAYFFPLTERDPSPKRLKGVVPYLGKIAVREIQVFDRDGTEIAQDAEVTGECAQGLENLKAVNDGDTSLAAAACVGKSPVTDGSQAGWIALDFGKTRSIGKVVVYHGVLNGAAAAWTAKKFSLEFWDGSDWRPLPRTAVADNCAERTEHAFATVETSKIRLKIDDQNGLYDYTAYKFSTDNPLLKIGQADNIPPDMPFIWWYIGHDGPTHFSWTANPNCDKASYLKWREKHPNFLGFQVAEFDNDIGVWLRWNRDNNLAERRFAERGKLCVIDQKLPETPHTREEAVKQLEQVFKRYKTMLFDEIGNFCGVSIWHHYGLEWGATHTTVENGGGGSPTLAMQNAAARGAGRQYGKPWGLYLATFEGSGYLDYRDKGKGGYSFGPDCGKSASLYRRQLFLTYLMGANFIDYEHSDIALLLEKPRPGVPVKLSPHGKAAAEIHDFDKAQQIRGSSYTPVALLLDWHHGWRHSESSKIFLGCFTPTAGDRMIDVLMRGLFGIDDNDREGHGFFMSSTGHSGIVDILVLNPPSGPVRAEVLNPYKAAILAGDIKIDSAAADRLKDYVRGGGTVAINAAQLNEFLGGDFTGLKLSGRTVSGSKAYILPDRRELIGEEKPYSCRVAELSTAKPLLVGEDNLPLVTVNRFGQGNVVVTLQPYLTESPANAAPKKGLATIHWLLSMLRYEALPVIVEADRPVEITLNRLPDGWRLGLLNNRGVYKLGPSAPTVKPEEKAEVKVTFKGKLKKAQEALSAQNVELSDVGGRSSFKISIPPGEVKIVDMTTE